MPDAAETVGAVAAAQDIQKSIKERLKGDFKMGSSTGSMFYAFGAFLILYLVGASIYQIFLWIRKWHEKKENDIEEK